MSRVRTCAHPEGSPNCWACAAEKATKQKERADAAEERVRELERQLARAQQRHEEAQESIRRVVEAQDRFLARAERAERERDEARQQTVRILDGAEAELVELRQALAKIQVHAAAPCEQPYEVAVRMNAMEEIARAALAGGQEPPLDMDLVRESLKAAHEGRMQEAEEVFAELDAAERNPAPPQDDEGCQEWCGEDNCPCDQEDAEVRAALGNPPQAKDMMAAFKQSSEAGRKRALGNPPAPQEGSGTCYHPMWMDAEGFPCVVCNPDVLSEEERNG